MKGGEAQKFIDFYQQLALNPAVLPQRVRVMNPYQDPNSEAMRLVKAFHLQFFNDNHPRKLLVGINPGRHGAGVTGIPFTDTPALQEHCGITTPLETRETSATFVYEFIKAYGGAEVFYQDWFIGGVCPLGFLVRNKKDNWVNWNYYDDRRLQENVTPFILAKLQEQIALCGHPTQCVVLGTGKNFKFLNQLNKQHALFEKITPLEHPRYVMQYKLKQKEHYIAKFLEVLTA